MSAGRDTLVRALKQRLANVEDEWTTKSAKMADKSENAQTTAISLEVSV